ncbi:MAG: ionic transporter y4hA [Beijerinckiaceae bacterium]|nr:ionic transporter y4hA [Beijerinckiaceae bacterium]
MPWWAWAWPSLAMAMLLGSAFGSLSAVMLGVSGVILISTVFAAVFHAEVVAHKVGEPYGTLVLALAVTVIEVALIVSIMISGGAEKSGMARDTVFAAVMIICNGLVGMCLLAGGVRHHIQDFRFEGALAALAVLAALVTLTLVLPNVVSDPGPVFSNPQVLFAGAASLVLYGSFVFVQTVRHRDYFLPAGGGSDEDHAAPPSARVAATSFGLLLISLVAVVGLAKLLSPTLEAGIDWLQIPKAVAGIVIAAVVLMPEGLAALRAARANRLQTSMNLALGSALASIGLTIPAVAVVSIIIAQPLSLGLGEKEQVLLALTLLVTVITLGTGRTTVLQGVVHLVIFVAFLFFTILP